MANPLPKLAMRPITMIRALLQTQAAGGYVLMLAAALAMIVANSDWSETYVHTLHVHIAGLSVLHWINDGLMAIFFLLVGLEIKREFLIGEMSSWPRRILPGAAALAGMAVPAAVFLFFNADVPGNARGWAIPSATDIAFALGVLALLGPRIPGSIKLLLTAIAVIDDLGAIVVIAVAYTSSLNVTALAAAVGIALVMLFLNRRGVRLIWPYLLLGAALWAAVLLSGVHATLAGVVTALAIPLTSGRGPVEAADCPLLRLEHALSPVVAFAIVPIFGFANAGVDLRGLSLDQAVAPLPLGIAAGLVLGKQLGIFATIMGLARTNFADAPVGASTRQIWGLSILCGIGFTMSLFIAALAYGEGSAQEAGAKLGIIAGSLTSALLGVAVLAGSKREA